jgi:hemin uptake protein HemP
MIAAALSARKVAHDRGQTASIPTPTELVYDASTLTGANGQARIILGDQVYTLRITRSGKLILTK